MEIRQTDIFAKWFTGLRDRQAKAAMLQRFDRAVLGNLGHVRTVGKGVSEMKIDVGAGYRAYFTIRQQTVIFLLCGGSKSTQQADIARAQELAKLV